MPWSLARVLLRCSSLLDMAGKVQEPCSSWERGPRHMYFAGTSASVGDRDAATRDRLRARVNARANVDASARPACPLPLLSPLPSPALFVAFLLSATLSLSPLALASLTLMYHDLALYPRPSRL